MAIGGDIRDTFFQECDELLEALDDGLTQIDEELGTGGCEDETVNAVFRAVHSIKGGAGAFGLEDLVSFAHCFESVLDAVRAGRLPADGALMQLFHRASDRLSDLVLAARDDTPLDPAGSATLMQALDACLPGGGASEPAPPAALSEEEEDFGFIPSLAPLTLDLPGEEPGATCYEIRFSASRALYASGNDTALLFRALGELGEMEVSVSAARLPAFEAFDWEEGYLDWTVLLATAEREHVILEVFEFVDGLCALDVAPLDEGAPAPPDHDATSGAWRESAEDADAVGPDRAGGTAPATLAGVEAPPSAAPASPAKAPAAPAPEAAAPARKVAAGGQATVRVDLDRVDRLINAVGELVINQAMLSQRVHEAGISPRSDIGAGLDAFRNLAREIQESVMAIRAQSVKPLFQRMSRIVREACDASGKQARLVTEGEATEVDKTVIERLADPLTHMIRNSVDHGLETAEVRRKAGKPEVGTITLSAAHRSGRVVIEVADDGAGIDRARVREIAVSKGLIPEEAELNDAEIDKLLFMPGFSTAKQVSSLSGRGVGMDVVKSSIQALGGRVSIQSAPGKGTTLSISLPLTLAVLDGMVVDVSGQTMVVPITAIVETLRPPPGDIHLLGSDSQVVAIRGTFVPIVDLGESFGHREAVRDYAERVLLLVETDQNARCALAVDAIHDQRQVVIKGLEANYGHVPGVAAATILGDGQIALIIDPEETVAAANRSVLPAALQLSAGG